MNHDRIAQLKSFLEDDPSDPFTKYALALEHLEEAPKISLDLFKELLAAHPDYVGTYYHAAALMTELNLRTEAADVYQKGIAIAQKKGDAHALRELQTAYMNFQFDE